MEKRPKLKLTLTKADKAFEFIGYILILAFWGLIVANYQSLPDIIPIHFNAAGIADNFGKKWMILTLPLVSTVVFFGLTILNRFPHIFNYPTVITAENALRQYTHATRMIRYLKVIIVVIFGVIAYQTIRHANGHTAGLGIWFFLISLGLTFTPLIYFVIASYKTPK